MFTANSFACYRHLDSRSREKDVELKIPRSIAYVFTRARWSRMPNLRGAPRGPKPWHTFDVPRAETATRLPSTTAWRHHQALRHNYQASLCFTALGKYVLVSKMFLFLGESFILLRIAQISALTTMFIWSKEHAQYVLDYHGSGQKRICNTRSHLLSHLLQVTKKMAHIMNHTYLYSE